MGYEPDVISATVSEARRLAHDLITKTHFVTQLDAALDHRERVGRAAGIQQAIELLRAYSPPEAKWVQLLIDRLGEEL